MAKTTTKVKKVTPTPAPPGATPDKRTPSNLHELVLSPTIHGAVGVQAWSKQFGEVDLAELILEEREQVKKVLEGDMSSVEAMLYGQALTLQTIFTSLARKAQAQEYLKQFQVNLTLALKAQAQCRATLEALAEIKNPRPVLIAKQANVANGPQQVNNGVNAESGAVRAGASAHAGQNTSLQNGLLEAPHGNYLDTRAQSTAGGADPHLEAVAAGNRAAYP